MMNTRNGTLSPISTDSNDWSPIGRYQNFAGDNPYSPGLPPSSQGGFTPPTSQHGSGTTDGSNGNRQNGNPSPPNSVGRSSDGTGLYAASINEGQMGPPRRQMPVLEETLEEHYRVLKAYLGPYLQDEKGNPRPSRAKDKLTRLSPVQFQELSTDVYDESQRREQDRKRGGPGAPANDTPKFLLPKNNFHPKRNQARQKLSTLPLERFRQLATDVYYELERRNPRFGGGDVLRAGSPTGSMASRSSTNRGPPSRVGTPNSMNGGMRGGRPPPGGYRPGPPPMGGPPPMPGGGGLRPGDGSNNDFGRPLPKTFQQNTIVPNKGTMVEDDDSGPDDEDAFNLEGAAARRQTNKSAKSMGEAQEKIVTDLQNQLSELQNKVDSLEGTVREKDGQLQKLQDAEKTRDGNANSERAEWDELRYSLEEKIDQAETLNSSLRSDIDRLRNENADMENNLRAQIATLEATPRQQSRAEDHGKWEQRIEELEQELSEQQLITEEVRRDAQTFLQEMRELSSRNEGALEKEERLTSQVAALATELKDWKSRYTRAKAQLRTLKTSSVGLASLASPDITNYTREASFTTPDGAVKDIHVTSFQLSVDELLQVARRSDSEKILESMRHVVKCVRAITGDIDNTPLSQMQSPIRSVNGDAAPEKQQAKLKARVSATANNLITASKNHASSIGLSPVSLLDAAASHLSTAIVELVKHVKVRPSPQDELDDEEDDRPMPLKPNVYSSYSTYSQTNGNSTAIGLGLGHQRQRSKGGSSGSTGYSTYSSPYSGYDRQSIGMNGGYEKESGMTEFKNYLEDQTATLVQSIQPLVNLIRSTAVTSPDDERRINDFIDDISHAVQDTANRTHDAVKDLSSPALKKHAVPVVDMLETCRLNMLDIDVRDGGRERIPPLAFKTARALKELVLRVDRIESGELTVDQNLPNDF